MYVCMYIYIYMYELKVTIYILIISADLLSRRCGELTRASGS